MLHDSGDPGEFRRGPETRVFGTRRAWEEIAVGDRVVVSWRSVDIPRRAYAIEVLRPVPAPESGE